jgi:catechol 2,3-dioxygenase-like lactoylglutathione lyase family enzyme
MPRISHIVLPVSDLERSKEWYVNRLGFALDREHESVVGIKDHAGLTIFLVRTSDSLAGPKAGLTIQVDDVDRTHRELVAVGIRFVSPPSLLFWGYGAEVLDPDGYMNHLWDEVTMARATAEARR